MEAPRGETSESEIVRAAEPKRAATGGEKTADRPHRFTLLTSIAAVVISFCGLGVSWLSYTTSSRATQASLTLNESNQRLSQMVQGAVIDTSNEFLGSLESLDRMKPGSTRQFAFSWTIANAGNTAANKVRSLRVVIFATPSGSRELGPPNRFTVHMAPRQKQSLPFIVTLSSEEYQSFRRGKAWLEINGQILYDDVFGANHEVDSYFRLKGDGLTEYRQFAPVQGKP
jgi:hypothetical protein